MRVSQFPLSTMKETPADAEVISHKLMLRAGMIRRLSSGLYTWMPLGLRVLRKVEQVVREEMDRAGALEVLMPAVQPAELWGETGRWEQFGPQLLKMQDRHERDYCFGPTHEEVITDLMRRELKSYKQLPVNYYQIQTKFRDEIRPRFGVMRAREFLMKDAYSFNLDKESLAESFWSMHTAYTNTFTRLGLRFRAVEADSGAIGGSGSMEFHVLADSGEDDIAYSTESDYAANIEKAIAVCNTPRGEATEACRLVDTPDTKTINALVDGFDLPIEKTIKTLIVAAAEDSEHALIALIVRGDHNLNEVKAENLPEVASPLRFAEEDEIRAAVGAGPGSLGPMNLAIPCIVDHSVAAMADFAGGANVDDKHYFGINWERDLPLPPTADIRNVVEGDPSPDGNGILKIMRGIEVGHIFQLGSKYSEAMDATVLGESGKPVTVEMGCYGIGVSRVVAAAIEQNNDDNGIIWPEALAPFQVAIVPINGHKSETVQTASEALYQSLTAAGIEVILDDRDARPGVKFADMELIGIPHRVVLSDKGLKKGTVEYRGRTDRASEDIPQDDIISLLQQKMGA